MQNNDKSKTVKITSGKCSEFGNLQYVVGFHKDKDKLSLKIFYADNLNETPLDTLSLHTKLKDELKDFNHTTLFYIGNGREVRYYWKQKHSSLFTDYLKFQSPVKEEFVLNIEKNHRGYFLTYNTETDEYRALTSQELITFEKCIKIFHNEREFPFGFQLCFTFIGDYIPDESFFNPDTNTNGCYLVLTRKNDEIVAYMSDICCKLCFTDVNQVLNIYELPFTDGTFIAQKSDEQILEYDCAKKESLGCIKIEDRILDLVGTNDAVIYSKDNGLYIGQTSSEAQEILSKIQYQDKDGSWHPVKFKEVDNVDYFYSILQ